MNSEKFNNCVWELERFNKINESEAEEFAADIRALQKAVEAQAPEGCVIVTIPHQLEPIVKLFEKLNESDLEVLQRLAGKFVRYQERLPG